MTSHVHDPTIVSSHSTSIAAPAIRDALEEGSRRARAAGEVQWLALRVRLADGDPLAFFEACDGGDRFYWEQPSRDRALATHGCVCAIEASGSDRFGETAARVQSVFRRLSLIGEPAPDEAGPLFVGGFSFDSAPRAADGESEWGAFPPGRLVLPELQLHREGERTWCTAVCLVEPGCDAEEEARVLLKRLEAGMAFEGSAWCEDTDAGAEEADRVEPADDHRHSSSGRTPAYAEECSGGAEYRVVADRPHRVYRSQVREALDSAAEGELEKVVLARSLEVIHPGRFGLTSLLNRLRCIYPTCTIFAVGRDDHALVAASPERLVRLDGDRVETGALAGSAPRGRTPEEDERLGRELRESKKDQAEHETVVRAVRAALSDACGPLDGPETPELMRVEGIQHLHTPLSGRLGSQEAGSAAASNGARSTPGILDLVASLHPTPAVGGLPRESALDWLREREALDRGWYAGPVGFVDASGGGEFWLALRSALIRNPAAKGPAASVPEARARLFAGAGIVLGSDPELELRETRLKLRALLAPLTEI